MSTLAEKGRAFRALHEHGQGFIIPNPWDVGTARILARLSFDYAFSIGRRDGMVQRDEAPIHLGVIAAATSLPISADLEKGFGDDPAHGKMFPVSFVSGRFPCGIHLL